MPQTLEREVWRLTSPLGAAMLDTQLCTNESRAARSGILKALVKEERSLSREQVTMQLLGVAE
jgi:hypothetical protein